MDKAGFGICGHKNSYTSKVHDGNWSEDKIATDLLMTREVPKPSYETEQRGRFQDPKYVPEDPRMATIKLESVDDIRARNKEGLSYSLIFEHGAAPETPEERFKTQYQESSDAKNNQYAQPDGTLRQKKLQAVEDECFDALNMTTMTQKANQRLNTSPPKTAAQLRVQKLKDDLVPETLPKWNRRSVK